MSVEGGVAKYYAWDGGQIIAEYEAWGTNGLIWKTSYVYLGGRLLATTSGADGNETRFHHPDRLGTRLVTNASDGAVVSEQWTLPFGNMQPFVSAPGGENPYQHPTLANPSKKRFTSYDRSDATGLDYAVNRFYSPQQGRFTQVDPIGMSAVSLSDPQTLNLYAYCGNDPINHVDPDGLFFKKLFGWIGKIGKIFKWIGIAITIAVGVLSMVGAVGVAFKISMFFAKHKFLANLLGIGSKLGIFRTPPINGFRDDLPFVGTVERIVTQEPHTLWNKLKELGRRAWDWSLDEGLSHVNDFIAGFADSLTFGATDYIREKMGTNGTVNKCSGFYKAGEYTEVGGEILATGGSALLKNAAKNAVRAEGLCCTNQNEVLRTQ